MPNKAQIYYNNRTNQWLITRKGGSTVLEIPDGNTSVQRFIGFVGSSALITAVGVADEVTGTITNATGLAVGDKVFGNPRPVIAAAAKIALSYFNVPTANVLNFKAVNIGTMAGSLAASGWDIFAIRSS